MTPNATAARALRPWALLPAALVAAGALTLAAPATEALAYTAPVQTDATTTSVSVSYEIDPYYKNVEMDYVEVKVSGDEGGGIYRRATTSALTPTSATITGLEPGKTYTATLHYTYNNNDLVRSSTQTISQLYTVGDMKGVKITPAVTLHGSGKISFNIDDPGLLCGYEVKLDAAAGSRYDKTFGDSYNYGRSSNRIYTDTIKLNTHTTYTAKMRTYIACNDGKTKKWSEWSKPITVIPETELTYKVKRKSGGLNISWKKTAGVKSYTVYTSGKPSSGFKAVATTSKTNATFKKAGSSKLKKGKKVYFYVVAKAADGTKSKTSTWYTNY